MSVETALLTAEEFVQITNEQDGLCELVRGEVHLMTRPGTRHGVVCSRLIGRLQSWNDTDDSGIVVSNDAGVLTERNPDSVRGPDIYYISNDRLPAGEFEAGWLSIPPELCVEVLSPSDRWNAVLEKIGEFLRAGVIEIWIAAPSKKQVFVYRSDTEPTTFGHGETLTSVLFPGFECEIDWLFRGNRVGKS